MPSTEVRSTRTGSASPATAVERKSPNAHWPSQQCSKAGSSGDGGDGGPGNEVGDRINAPLLAQTTEAVGVLLAPVIRGLRARGIPAEMVLFPDETHAFHQPRHREAAMRQNLDWFGRHLG
jgi:hypothetical protein